MAAKAKSFLQSLSPRSRARLLAKAVSTSAGESASCYSTHSCPQLTPDQLSAFEPLEPHADRGCSNEVALRVRASALEVEQDRLQQQLDAERSNVRRMEQQIEELSRDLGQRKSQLQAAQTEARSAQHLVHKQVQRADRMATAVGELQRENGTLSAQLLAQARQAGKEKEQLQAKVQELQARIAELQQGYVALASSAGSDALDGKALQRRGQVALAYSMLEAAPATGGAGAVVQRLDPDASAGLGKWDRQELAKANSLITQLTRQRDDLQVRVQQLSARLADSSADHRGARSVQAVRGGAWQKAALAAEGKLAVALKRVKQLSEQHSQREADLKQRDHYISRLERTVLVQHKSLQQHRQLVLQLQGGGSCGSSSAGGSAVALLEPNQPLCLPPSPAVAATATTAHGTHLHNESLALSQPAPLGQGPGPHAVLQQQLAEVEHNLTELYTALEHYKSPRPGSGRRPQQRPDSAGRVPRAPGAQQRSDGLNGPEPVSPAMRLDISSGGSMQQLTVSSSGGGTGNSDGGVTWGLASSWRVPRASQASAGLRDRLESSGPGDNNESGASTPARSATRGSIAEHRSSAAAAPGCSSGAGSLAAPDCDAPQPSDEDYEPELLDPGSEPPSLYASRRQSACSAVSYGRLETPGGGSQRSSRPAVAASAEQQQAGARSSAQRLLSPARAAAGLRRAGSDAGPSLQRPSRSPQVAGLSASAGGCLQGAAASLQHGGHGSLVASPLPRRSASTTDHSRGGEIELAEGNDDYENSKRGCCLHVCCGATASAAGAQTGRHRSPCAGAIDAHTDGEAEQPRPGLPRFAQHMLHHLLKCASPHGSTPLALDGCCGGYDGSATAGSGGPSRAHSAQRQGRSPSPQPGPGGRHTRAHSGDWEGRRASGSSAGPKALPGPPRVGSGRHGGDAVAQRGSVDAAAGDRPASAAGLRQRTASPATSTSVSASYAELLRRMPLQAVRLQPRSPQPPPQRLAGQRAATPPLGMQQLQQHQPHLHSSARRSGTAITQGSMASSSSVAGGRAPAVAPGASRPQLAAAAAAAQRLRDGALHSESDDDYDGGWVGLGPWEVAAPDRGIANDSQADLEHAALQAYGAVNHGVSTARQPLAAWPAAASEPQRQQLPASWQHGIDHHQLSTMHLPAGRVEQLLQQHGHGLPAPPSLQSGFPPSSSSLAAWLDPAAEADVATMGVAGSQSQAVPAAPARTVRWQLPASSESLALDQASGHGRQHDLPPAERVQQDHKGQQEHVAGQNAVDASDAGSKPVSLMRGSVYAELPLDGGLEELSDAVVGWLQAASGLDAAPVYSYPAPGNRIASGSEADVRCRDTQVSPPRQSTIMLQLHMQPGSGNGAVGHMPASPGAVAASDGSSSPAASASVGSPSWRLLGAVAQPERDAVPLPYAVTSAYDDDKGPGWEQHARDALPLGSARHLDQSPRSRAAHSAAPSVSALSKSALGESKQPALTADSWAATDEMGVQAQGGDDAAPEVDNIAALLGEASMALQQLSARLLPVVGS